MPREDIIYSTKGIFELNPKLYSQKDIEDSEDELKNLDKSKISSDE